ncbi:MAG: SNF2-related protein [Mycoplasma sp.]
MIIYDTLYDFQKETFHKLMSMDCGLLALDLGLGKTKTATAMIESLLEEDQVDNILLICQGNKIDEWIAEIRLFSEKYENEGWKIIHLNKIKENVNTINNNYEKTIFVTSYAMFTALNDYFISEDCKFNNRTAWFYDECQTMKNYTSKVSQAGMNLSKINLKKVIMISGDPISNGYNDLFVLMKILRFDFDNWGDNWEMDKVFFENYFCKWKNMQINKWTNIPKICGYKHTKELIDLLHTKSVFKKTKDVIELPEQVFNDIKIPLCKKSRSILLGMKKYIQDNTIEKKWGGPIQVKELIDIFRHSRSLSSGFLKQGNYIEEIHEKKLEALDSLVYGTYKNLVIFYNFNYEIKKIKERYKDTHSFVEINGLDKSEKDVSKKIKNIGKEKTLILVNYKSGAVGINLQSVGSITVYYSLTTSGELYKQSLKRVHRTGQTETCFYYHLIGEGTVEEQIYNTLKESQKYTEEFFTEKKVINYTDDMFLDWIKNYN